MLSKKSALDKADKSKASGDSEVDYKERKQIQKNLKNAEKKIEKLEQDIKTLETLMAEPEFYESANSEKKISEYESKKASLAKTLVIWEEAALKLDQLD